VDAADIQDGPPTKKSRTVYRPRLPRGNWISLVLLGFVAFFSVFARGFFSVGTLTATAAYATEPLILALGQTLVIISGGIDISVGSVLGLSGVAAALTMRHLAVAAGPATGIIAGVLTGLVVGGVVGFANGKIVSRFLIPPFVVTLGMLGITRGLVFVLTRGTSVSDLPKPFVHLAEWNLFGYLPVAILVAALLILGVGWILRETLLGRYIYAIGGNEQAAIRAGVDVPKIKVIVYVLSGVLAAVAGLLALIRFSTASPLAGSNRELDSIAAAVIGGASLSGGKGTVSGSVVGALIVSVLLIGLVIMNVEPYWQMVAVGALVILAVTIDRLSERDRR
jgi:ribose transport system permease protein